jgi:hypothetical protein
VTTVLLHARRAPPPGVTSFHSHGDRLSRRPRRLQCRLNPGRGAGGSNRLSVQHRPGGRQRSLRLSSCPGARKHDPMYLLLGDPSDLTEQSERSGDLGGPSGLAPILGDLSRRLDHGTDIGQNPERLMRLLRQIKALAVAEQPLDEPFQFLLSHEGKSSQPLPRGGNINPTQTKWRRALLE